MATTDLNSYVAVKFVTTITSTGNGMLGGQAHRMSVLRQNFHATSYVQIWASSETSIGKIRNIIDEGGQGISSKNEVMLAEREITNEFDWMDGESH